VRLSAMPVTSKLLGESSMQAVRSTICNAAEAGRCSFGRPGLINNALHELFFHYVVFREENVADNRRNILQRFCSSVGRIGCFEISWRVWSPMIWLGTGGIRSMENVRFFFASNARTSSRTFSMMTVKAWCLSGWINSDACRHSL